MIGAKSKLPNINGYQLLEEWSTSGSARWSYASKNGKKWFIKQFMSPKYKSIEDNISAKKVESSRIRCEKFRKSKEALYERIELANTGNIVIVDDFFSFGSQFYAVSEKVDISSVSEQDIAKLSHEKKIVLMKVLTYSLMSLHRKGVVHADLKPDNVLIKKTRAGYTLKLIDFDTSYLETEPARGNDIGFDMRFVAPETVAAMDDVSISLTAKVDIFALGILFHIYYTGIPPKIPDTYPNICGAVCNGFRPKLDSSIPKWLADLIQKMLDIDPRHRPNAAEIFSSLNAQSNISGKTFHLPSELR